MRTRPGDYSGMWDVVVENWRWLGRLRRLRRLPRAAVVGLLAATALGAAAWVIASQIDFGFLSGGPESGSGEEEAERGGSSSLERCRGASERDLSCRGVVLAKPPRVRPSKRRPPKVDHKAGSGGSQRSGDDADMRGQPVEDAGAAPTAAEPLPPIRYRPPAVTGGLDLDRPRYPDSDLLEDYLADREKPAEYDDRPTRPADPEELPTYPEEEDEIDVSPEPEPELDRAADGPSFDGYTDSSPGGGY